MEILHFSSSFVMLVFLLLSTFIFFKLKFKSNISTANLPPGPWKLPLIGNFHNLIGSMPHHALHEQALKYGPLMHVQLGELSIVVISSPDAAKQIMRTHDLNFASRPSILLAEIMGYNCTGIGFSPYGAYWKQLRRICNQEVLSVNRVQSMRSLREEVFFGLAKWIAGREGLTAFNLTDKLYSSTYALIATAAVGKKYNEHNRLLPILREAISYGAGFDIAEVYPSIKLFKIMSSTRRRLSTLHHEVDKILDDIICKHKVANSVVDGQQDLVDVLLRYQDHGLDLPLTNDNIKAVILDILTGGTETAATTMDWAMAEMIKNPEIMKKAQQEVRNVFDSKESRVDESCIHELKYLKAVIKETLRLHPPLPLSVPRKCRETCEINGYQIPANTKIIINIWAINRDSNYWKNGHCFQPERFLDSEVDFKGNHFEFIPFGAGRRVCPGLSFGLASVELPLAILLYHFDWNLPIGENHQYMNMQEAFGQTVSRLKNLFLVPVIKRPLPTQ